MGSTPAGHAADSPGQLLEQALLHHQSGDLAVAEALYRQLLELDPGSYDAMHLLGVVALQRDRLAEAEHLITRALDLAPNSSAAHNNLGNVYLRRNELQDARLHFDRAVQLQPDFTAAHMNLGTVLRRLGQNREAAVHLRQAATLDPHSTTVRSVLGSVLLELRDFQAAIGVFEEAIRLNPAQPDAHSNLAAAWIEAGEPGSALAVVENAGRSLGAETPALLTNRGIALGLLGRFEEARDALERVIALTPDSAAAHRNLGKLLRETGGPEQAIALLQHAVELEPESAPTQIDLIQALHEAGWADEAEEHANALLDRHPEFVAVWAVLGALRFDRGDHRGAEQAWREALALEPDHADAHYQLGNLAMLAGRSAEAAVCYQASLNADPDHVQSRWALAMASIPAIAENEADVESSRAAFSAALNDLEHYFDARRTPTGYLAVGSTQPFYLAFQADDNRELLGRYGALCVRLMADWQERHITLPPPRPKSDRIRIGIVSAHVYDHSVWNAITSGWLQNLDRDRFELVVFSLGPQCDEQTAQAMDWADRFESGHGSLQRWAQLISASGIDALIYPEIGMHALTTRLASLRLAPVQAAAWGHAETTGLPTMDYYLSAAAMEPESAEFAYTERLLLLPNLGVCYQPMQVKPAEPDLAALGLPDDAPLLLCPGQPYKYAPAQDRIWVEISRRIRPARLVFFGPRDSDLSRKLRTRLGAAYQDAGLDFADCVSFIPFLDRPSFFGLMQRAHAFLDTFGFSGFNTVMQAVECAVPIVTREGRFLRGRLGSGVLRRMGLPELVATTDQAYVDLAVSLALDPERRPAVSRQIAARRALLFNDTAPVRALESLLTQVLAQ